MKNKEKKQLNEDIWMVASDIAKQSRDYLRWHAGKPCNNFNLTQYRKALAEFVSFMESYEQQTEQAWTRTLGEGEKPAMQVALMAGTGKSAP